MSNYQTADREGHGLGYTIPQLEQALYERTSRIKNLENALKQIAWLADADEPLSVKAAEIARTALNDKPAPKPPLCGYCGDRPSSLVPCPECDS